jgi:hypothetical protein
MNLHEDLTRKTGAEASSDRGFGVVFTVFFLVVALWPLRHGGPVRLWALAASAVMLALALLRPSVLRVPNRWWMKLAELLARITNPLVTGILFYAAFTPMGLIVRWMGKDPLRLRYDRSATTYWIERTPPGPPAASMSNQF